MKNSHIALYDSTLSDDIIAINNAADFLITKYVIMLTYSDHVGNRATTSRILILLHVSTPQQCLVVPLILLDF